MIKKNYKDVGFVYKGTQVIDKIYKGTDLVFEQGYTREQTGVPPIITSYQAIGKNLKDYKIYGNSIQGKLPSEYQQVGYIESTGTQYIDTGIIPISSTRIDINFAYVSTTDYSGWVPIFGARSIIDNVQEYYAVFINNSTLKLTTNYSSRDFGDNSNVYIEANKKYNLKNNQGSFYINDILESSISTSDTLSNNTRFPVYLFDLNFHGSKMNRGTKMKLYSCKFYDGDTLIRNYIPCYRKSDNEIGLYDTVNNVFYTNQGTGEFLKGSNAPTPSVPIEIESVGDKTKNLFNYKTASTYKGSFDNNGVFHATDNDNRDNLVYKIQLYNNNTMVTNSSRNISITGTGTYRITSPELIQSGTTRIRFANNGSLIEFSINCDIDGSQFVGQYASIVFTVDDATVGASVISDIMFYVGNEPFDYEPYGYKIPVIVGNTTTNIYLDEPLRKIDEYSDYIDFVNGKVIRQLGEVVLNGSETWNKINNAFQTESNTTPNKANVTLNSLSSHFIHHYYSTSITTNIQNGEFGWNSVKNLTVRNDNCNTTNELKTWLQSNNVTVDYVLKIPTEETILLPNIPTIKGTTVIEIDTKIQPSNMYIKYKGK